jgi:hypothetical protein
LLETWNTISFYSFQICCLMKKLSNVQTSACVSSSTAAPVWAVSVHRPQLHCTFLWGRTSRLVMYVAFVLYNCVLIFTFIYLSCIIRSRHLGGVVFSVLVTGPKGCRFEPGQRGGFLRAIKIWSTPSFRWKQSQRPRVVRFYGMLKKSWSPTGMNRLNSHFLRPSPTYSRDVSGDGQSALVDKLGVSSSRSPLPRSTSLSPGDRTVGPRLQFWDGCLAPTQRPIYNQSDLSLQTRFLSLALRFVHKRISWFGVTLITHRKLNLYTFIMVTLIVQKLHRVPYSVRSVL